MKEEIVLFTSREAPQLILIGSLCRWGGLIDCQAI